ncbi:membrane-bound lytic murein transglycosylase MltC [Arsenophonus symbiont of Ornithomya chloropus]|uniref:membrane-bound lytic murein transglycosylase MltC n=1 Tax=Arsenophonus symbiont of Ornithomya chloropus TaxID=634121 RepID=UPI003D6C778D
MKKLILLFFVIQGLPACTSKKEILLTNSETIRNTNGLDILVQQLVYNIESIWGIDELLIVGPQDYVEYIDHYQTRAHINFDIGNFTIETIINTEPHKFLKKAFFSSLLVNNKLKFVNSHFKLEGCAKNYYLSSQDFDDKYKNIKSVCNIKKNLDYSLLQYKLKKRRSRFNIIWSITIKLIPNNFDQRAQKYLPYIRQAAEKYGIDMSLILSIMQIESSFDPYAISHADALGLMQIMQNSAGRDVFRVQGKTGIPNRNDLLDPAYNIDVGTAYLSLLQNTYLSKISNITSRRYALITAYNGGIGSLLKVFHNNKKQALKIINQMRPRDVYHILVTKHPLIQARHYLIKVNNIQRNYFKEIN